VSKRPEPKPCLFVGSSHKDLKRFPTKVQNRLGYALYKAEGDEPAVREGCKDSAAAPF
jgi:phage-related protein